MKEVVWCMEFDQNSGGGVRVAIVTYNTGGTVRLYLNQGTTRGSVIARINALPNPSGGTNMRAGLDRLRDVYTSSRGDRCKVCNVAIVLSDRDQTQGDVFPRLDLLKAPPIYNIKFFSVCKYPVKILIWCRLLYGL